MFVVVQVNLESRLREKAFHLSKWDENDDMLNS